MTRSRGAYLWLARGAYLGSALVLMSLLLMPLWIEPGGVPGPELLTILTFAWVLRRPEQVPALLIAVAMLTADLMLQRPPGLWACLALAGSEILRGRRRSSRPLPFAMEWLLVALIIAAMSMTDWLLLTMTLASHAPLKDMLAATAVTIVAYPLPVLALRLAGIRRVEYSQGVIQDSRMRRSEKDVDRSAGSITRRSIVLGGLQFAMMGALGLRLRHMQVEQAAEYRLLAEENRINVRLLAPQRGLILDRKGRPVAENDQNYRVVIVREDADDVEAVLYRLADLIPLNKEDVERTLREVSRRSAFVPVTVKDQMPWEDLARVAINAPALPGVRPEVGQTRNYPLGQDFAHVVGYVGPVSDYDLSKLEDPDPLLQIPKFQIGKAGVEAKMEEVLRGKAGNSQIEVNAIGRVMRELSRTEGTSGKNIQLTIDAALQNFTQARLASEESAGVVVVDCTNGDIMAAVSSPSFDPNLFVRGISVSDYKALTGNKYRPLASKTVQGTYPPGSTFKMVVALAGLEAGVISPEATEWCPGYLESGGRRFHCWKSGGHGHVNLNAALQQSCDVYFYEIAQMIGIDRITAMAQKLGLGTRFDLPLSAVSEGLTPTKDWKRKSYGQEWQVGDTINASIGQGYVLASPLQLAVMTARIASGNAVMPRLIKTIDGEEQPISAEPMGLNPRHLRAVQGGMDAVSNSRHGTGYKSRVVIDSLRIAGKSGTSQVRNITKAERARGVTRNDQLPWERRDHALFVSFGPVSSPRYAVAVIVEHGSSGSAASAPIARDVLLAAMTGGMPPMEAYPSSQRDEVAERFRTMPMQDQFRTKDGKSRA